MVQYASYSSVMRKIVECTKTENALSSEVGEMCFAITLFTYLHIHRSGFLKEKE